MSQKKVRLGIVIYALVLMFFGIVYFNYPAELGPGGMASLITTSGVLVTDFVAYAGIGPAFVNASLVTLASLFLMVVTKYEIKGLGIATVAIMSGFALFGKDIVNIWPVVLGTFLYAKLSGDPPSKYICVGLMATAMSPAVSLLMFRRWPNPLGIAGGIAVGIFIGFAIHPVGAVVAKLHRGYTLYNVGLTLGFFALVIVPVMQAYGAGITTVSFFGRGYNGIFAPFLYAMSGGFIALGLASGRESVGGYFGILKSSGKSPSDFFAEFGAGAVAINMGINGTIATSYILLIGGELNGTTVGGILTIMGFSAFGKHARGIVPVLAGVVLAGGLGGLGGQWSLTDPAIQIAAIFSSTLSPIAGRFGVIAGILAGFLHTSVVRLAGSGYSGMNLYNNGFAGGIVAVVLINLLADWYKRKSEIEV